MTISSTTWKSQASLRWLDLILLVGTLCVNIAICHKISTIVPDPYMDEFFHVGQTKRYLAGNWTSWDPKITTPPGLYVFTSVIFMLKTSIITMFHLRMVNVLFSFLNHWLLLKILRRERQTSEARLTALSLALYPPLYFFSFFFYTDQCSLFLVLAAFHAHNLGHGRCSALLAGLSLTLRQTNVIWLLFLFALHMARQFVYVISRPSQLHTSSQWIVHCFVFLKQQPMRFAQLLLEGLLDCKYYVVVALAFAGFVLWNGSIVLGDKQAHQAGLHLPQFFYFITFSACLRPLELVYFSSRLLQSIPKLIQHKVMLCLFAAVALVHMAFLFVSIHCCTFVHPYLLADNRHYMFYIWRRIIDRTAWSRYAFAPVYLAFTYFWWDQLLPFGRRITLRNFLEVVCLWICTMLCLVPSTLLEVRYFIVPFIFYRFYSHPTRVKRSSIVSEVILYSIINMATIALFIFKPFQWISEPGVQQRFMW